MLPLGPPPESAGPIPTARRRGPTARGPGLRPGFADGCCRPPPRRSGCPCVRSRSAGRSPPRPWFRGGRSKPEGPSWHRPSPPDKRVRYECCVPGRARARPATARGPLRRGRRSGRRPDWAPAVRAPCPPARGPTLEVVVRRRRWSPGSRTAARLPRASRQAPVRYRGAVGPRGCGSLPPGISRDIRGGD